MSQTRLLSFAELIMAKSQFISVITGKLFRFTNQNYKHLQEMEQRQILWEFLLKLLSDEKNKEIISWTNNFGEFRLNRSQEVARLWGRKKEREGMNYQKMSRALRGYYGKGLIEKTPGRSFVYKFVALHELVTECKIQETKFDAITCSSDYPDLNYDDEPTSFTASPSTVLPKYCEFSDSLVSACPKFRTEQYCCPGESEFGTPQTCNASNYANYFKQRCPDAYSYAYNDEKNTHTCRSAEGRSSGYLVTFC